MNIIKMRSVCIRLSTEPGNEAKHHATVHVSHVCKSTWLIAFTVSRNLLGRICLVLQLLQRMLLFVCFLFSLPQGQPRECFHLLNSSFCSQQQNSLEDYMLKLDYNTHLKCSFNLNSLILHITLIRV